MSLAGKFGNFEIKKTDRISKEDQEWLIRREKMYKRALIVQKSVYDIYKAEDGTYSEEDRDEFSSFTVNDFGVPKRVSQIQDSYISGIFSSSVSWIKHSKPFFSILSAMIFLYSGFRFSSVGSNSRI